MKYWELQINANFGMLTNESPKPCHKNPKQKSQKFNKKNKNLILKTKVMSLKFLFKNIENKSQKLHVKIQDQKIKKLNFK